MTLTYVDQPLIVPTREVVEWIYKNIDPNDVVPWVTRAFPGAHYTKLTWPTGYLVPRHIQIGRLVWPNTASRWAYGFFLIDAKYLDIIRDQIFSTNGRTFAPGELIMDSFETEDPLYEQLSAEKMYVLSYFPLSNIVLTAGGYLSQYLQDKINNLYMLILVDERYYWWNYSTGPLNITGTDTTWTSVFEQIGSILDVEISVDPISSKYLNVHKCLNLPYEVVPPYLDALASNVGQRIWVDFDGHVFSQNFDNAKATRQADDSSHPNRNVRAGNYFYLSKL